MGRFIHFTIALCGTIAGALIAATSGYVLANFTPSPDVIPLWLWNLTFTTMMLMGIIVFGYCMFSALDELFLKEDDTRRITGKRTCCVTRRPS
jgi:hypothetical protein